MSVEYLSKVFKESKSTLAARLVLLALADFANDHGECWPAVETIANKAMISERNARLCIRKLEESGELEVRINGARKATNLYRIILGGKNFQGEKDDKGEGQKTTKKLSEIAPEPSGTVTEPNTAGEEGRRVQDLVDMWNESFGLQFGRDYKFHPADFKAAKQLLKTTKRTAGEIMRVATAAWARKGPRFFHCQQCLSISKLDKFWNEVLRELDAIPEAVAPKPAPKRNQKPPLSDRPLAGWPDPDDESKVLTQEEIDRRFPIENYDREH